MGEWYTDEGGGVFLVCVRAVPGAKKPGVVGLHGEAVKIRVAAPPEQGKANDALGAALASALGVRAADVTHVRGATSRNKVFRVEGTSAAALDAML